MLSVGKENLIESILFEKSLSEYEMYRYHMKYPILT